MIKAILIGMKRSKSKSSGSATSLPWRGLVILLLCMAIVGGAYFVFNGDSGAPDTIAQIQSAPWQPEGDLQAFNQTCIQIQDNGGASTVTPACQNFTNIKETFDVDAPLLIEIEKGRFIATAELIARGGVINQDNYEACITQRDCIDSPLFETLLKIKSLDNLSGRDLLAYRLYDHLLDTGQLTKELCGYMRVCQALYKSGAVTDDRFVTLPALK